MTPDVARERALRMLKMVRNIKTRMLKYFIFPSPDAMHLPQILHRAEQMFLRNQSISGFRYTLARGVCFCNGKHVDPQV
jgi:hypothetical protein